MWARAIAAEPPTEAEEDQASTVPVADEPEPRRKRRRRRRKPKTDGKPAGKSDDPVFRFGPDRRTPDINVDDF